MRWIKRGPEPDGVQEYAQRFTQGWVDHFRDGQGKRPENWHWGEYRRLLGSYSNGNCWYCERRCMRHAEDGGKAPTVDHFKPKNRFPAKVYEWSNWHFSCLRCNGDYKGDLWPPSGYVDPSAIDVRERPDQYFDYDIKTGEIVAKEGLPSEAWKRARRTINDLGLNEIDVRRYRLDLTRIFEADWRDLPTADRQAFEEHATSSDGEFLGAVLMVAQQLRDAAGT